MSNILLVCKGHESRCQCPCEGSPQGEDEGLEFLIKSFTVMLVFAPTIGEL